MATTSDKVFVPSSGFCAAKNVFESLAGEMYYKAFAEKIVSTKTEGELVQYIAEIFLGIESLKIEAAKRECPYHARTARV